MIVRTITMACQIVAIAVACAVAVARAQTNLSDMVAIPAGPFTMGSNEGPEDERPAHEVTVRPYSIDRFPVTNAQYAEYVNTLGTGRPGGVYDFDDPDARIHRQ